MGTVFGTLTRDVGTPPPRNVSLGRRTHNGNSER
jgi:hypothetical protein